MRKRMTNRFGDDTGRPTQGFGSGLALAALGAALGGLIGGAGYACTGMVAGLILWDSM